MTTKYCPDLCTFNNFLGDNYLDSSGSKCHAGKTTLENLVDAIDPNTPNRERYVSLLTLYGDESKTEGVFGVVVLISTLDRWAAFEQPWIDSLTRAGLFGPTGDLLPFHMADFESRHPPFDRWDNPKRIRVLGELLEIINATFLMGVVSAIPLVKYRHYLPINAGRSLDHKLHRCMLYMLCLHRIYTLTLPLLSLNPNIKRLQQVFDRNRDVASMVQSVHDILAEKYPAFDARVAGPIFESKTRVVQLQAADIAAYEAIKHRQNIPTKIVRKPYEILDQSRILNTDCDDDYLDAQATALYNFALTSGLIETEDSNGVRSDQ